MITVAPQIRQSAMAYCRIDELYPEEESEFENAVLGAISYLDDAGVSLPAEGTLRWHKYMRCLKALVLDDWDNRGTQNAGQALSENIAFRRKLNQLKLTEPVVSEPDTTGSSG